MTLRAVAFDLGETLVDESRYWGEWAARLGLTPLTLSAQLGAAIERGEHHRSLLPGVSEAEPSFAAEDLYPDARGALATAAGSGVRVAIAGNFSPEIAAEVRRWGLDAEFVASSRQLGAEKPASGFFVRLAAALGVDPSELVYVGDRIDNDALGARAAGCASAFLRRGPWAAIQERRLPWDGPAFDDLTAVVEWIRGQGDGR